MHASRRPFVSPRQMSSKPHRLSLIHKLLGVNLWRHSHPVLPRPGELALVLDFYHSRPLRPTFSTVWRFPRLMPSLSRALNY